MIWIKNQKIPLDFGDLLIISSWNTMYTISKLKQKLFVCLAMFAFF
jgi:hypothetical protein